VRDPKEVRKEYRRELEASIKRDNERIELPCLLCGRIFMTTRSRRFCAKCTERRGRWRDQDLKQRYSVPSKGASLMGDSLWSGGE